jgi:hypothetical protein
MDESTYRELVLRSFALLMRMNAHILRILASLLANNGQREAAYDLVYGAEESADNMIEVADGA